MIYLIYNTASQNVPIGPFVDDTDGKSAETALTIANTDIKIWKAGGTTMGNKNSGGATHMANGVYYMTLDATDTNTYGPLVIEVHVAGALPCKVTCMVVSSVWYNSMIGSDYLQVDTVQVGGTSQTANDMSGDVDTILSRVVGTLAAGTHNPQSGDAYTRLGAPAGASISADIATVDGNVDTLVTRIVGTLASGTHNAQSGDAYARLGAPIGASISADLQVVDSNVDAILVDTGTDIPASIAALPTAAANADAVWDEATAGHVTAGSFGVAATDILVDTGTTIPATLGTPAGASLAADIATVDANVDAILVDTDTTIPGVLGTPAGASLAADIATVDANVDAILVDTGTTIPATLGTPAGASLAADIAAVPTAAEIDSQLVSSHGAGSWAGFPQGSGAVEQTINVAANGSPQDGVEVWISTDSAGSNVVAGPNTTDAMGNAVFYLDAGSYYVWCQKAGVNFTNPSSITVS